MKIKMNMDMKMKMKFKLNMKKRIQMNKYYFKPVLDKYASMGFRKDEIEYPTWRKAGEDICVDMTEFNINDNSFINLKNKCL